MNLLNKLLINKYKNMLLNNQFLVFCELNSLNPSILRKLKIDLKKKDFLLVNIKNSLFKSYVKNSKFKALINGPIFIIYKKELNDVTDIAFLVKLLKSKYNFLLCYIFNQKVYNIKTFNWFKGIKDIENLYNKNLYSLNMALSVKLYGSIKQLKEKNI